MMKLIRLEFYKTRRRKIWLIVSSMVFVQLIWSLWAMSRMDETALQQGWQYLLYQFPTFNTIMMPVIASVIASRICDLEHKGKTFKLLETMTSAGRLFHAKFCCGAAYLTTVAAVQILMIAAMGTFKGFYGSLPLKQLTLYFLSTVVTTSALFVIQLSLSLLIENQMIPLTIGLAGALFGLVLLFFPQSLQRLFVWGYYGVLCIVGMDWDRETRAMDLFWVSWDVNGFLWFLVLSLVLYLIGRSLFQRKEM